MCVKDINLNTRNRSPRLIFFKVEEVDIFTHRSPSHVRQIFQMIEPSRFLYFSL